MQLSVKRRKRKQSGNYSCNDANGGLFLLLKLGSAYLEHKVKLLDFEVFMSQNFSCFHSPVIDIQTFLTL